MEQPILQVEHLTKFFSVGPHAEVHAVDDVNFTLRRGRTFGLVGESGCGKSSCARTIIRIYEPSQGKIIFNGQDIAHLKPRQMQPVRRNMQMIFQDPYASLNARMTVRDIIAEPLKAHHVCKSKQEVDEKVFAMLNRVGLTAEHAGRYAHEFSGGQRQRVGIARALVLNPALVICDEPISALDVSIQAQIINLLRQLQKDFGITYLFISHDLSVVEHISDTVGVMYLGTMVEYADTDKIFGEPLHPYTKALFSAIPIPDPDVKINRIILKGSLPSPANPPAGCKFHTRCEKCMDICRCAVPEWSEVEPGHWCACHLYNNPEQQARAEEALMEAKANGTCNEKKDEANL